MDITTVVTVDARCIRQLELVWPTWRLHRPGMLSQPMVIICDGATGDKAVWTRKLAFLGHKDRTIVCWDWQTCNAEITQRERMLTAWVKVPPTVVETPYFVKIDTDVLATHECPWILPEWFADSPALVASPWGYTKPATWPGILDDWATTIPELADRPALNLPTPTPDQRTIGHKRIASWCCFINTEFARQAARYVPGRLPVPSQDTYHWYVATRLGLPITKTKMKQYGWACIHSDRRRRKMVEEILGTQDAGCCG